MIVTGRREAKYVEMCNTHEAIAQDKYNAKKCYHHQWQNTSISKLQTTYIHSNTDDGQSTAGESHLYRRKLAVLIVVKF